MTTIERLTILLHIYLGLNMFMVGYYIKAGQEEGWFEKSSPNYLTARTMILLFALLGIPVAMLYGLWLFLDILNDILHIDLLFKFYFTKQYNTSSIYFLRVINRMKPSPNRIQRYMHNLCVRLINKRNSYDPSTDKDF